MKLNDQPKRLVRPLNEGMLFKEISKKFIFLIKNATIVS